MRFQGFIGPSYKLKSVNVDTQRCINLYPQMHELGTGKEGEVATLYGTPGLSLLVTIGDGPIRGSYKASNNELFVVSANKLYRVSSAWAATELGTLDTSVGMVCMADNGIHLVLVDGTSGYVWTFGSSSFAEITDEDFTSRTPPNQVSFLDGYFIFDEGDIDNFFISGLDDVTFDSLEFADADGYPDKLRGHIVKDRELWLFGEQSTEVWFNSGDAQFPFSRVSGAFIEVGCIARFSVAKTKESVFWLAADKDGQGLVYMANGYKPQKISTHAIDEAIQGYSNIEDAVAYTYQEDGHTFYVLNFPTANTTWVYDVSTSLWHERAYTSNGDLGRHRGICHAFAHGKHVVGDYENGKLYELSSSVYTDDGAAITRRRITPHVSSGMRRVFYNGLQIDIESGVGLDGTGQGTDPKMMLTYSDDGGSSWSNEKWASMGKIGKRKTRAKWNRMGASRDRVFSITVTDPVKVVLLGAELDFMVGGA